MEENKIIKWGICILGIFVLPPIMSLLIGIGLFICAAAPGPEEKQGLYRLYGFYWVLAAVCSYISFAIFH